MAEENVKIISPGRTNNGAAGEFGISVDELKSMMELRKGDAITNLQEHGGIEKLCQMLHTSPTNGMSCY